MFGPSAAVKKLMKKYCITAFTLLYTVLLVFGAAERAGQWAVREAKNLAHYEIVHGVKSLGGGGKSDSHVFQTRLLESGFVVEMPREAATSLVPSERHTNRIVTHLYVSRSPTLISSRAPPSLS